LNRRPARLASVLLLVLAGGTCPPVLADDPAEGPDGWTGTGELGFAMSRGNARTENLNARLAFARETTHGKHNWFLAAMRAKAEATGDFDGDGVEEERYGLSASRYEFGAGSGYKFDERNYIIGSGRYERDRFGSSDYQATLALSYGRKMIDAEETRLQGEIGPGFRRVRDAETGRTETRSIVRGHLDFSHTLTGNTDLVNKLLVESGDENTFAQNDLGLKVAMNEALALKAGLQVRHNTDVAPGARKTDTLTTLNLVYSFR
jgi:putative salt-induced outer membrane protein